MPPLPESRPRICTRDSGGHVALTSAVAARHNDSDLFIRRGAVDTEKRAEMLVTHRPLPAKLLFTQAVADARSGSNQKTQVHAPCFTHSLTNLLAHYDAALWLQFIVTHEYPIPDHRRRIGRPSGREGLA